MHLQIPDTPLIVRSWQTSDAPAIVPLADNPNVSAGLRDAFPSPYRLEDASCFLKSATLPGSTQFALVAADAVVGGIGWVPRTDVDRFTAEIGYWLGEPFWGRGWMTHAVRAFADWLLGPSSPARLARLEARVYDFNQASARVLEKAGFVFEGRHRCAVFKRGAFHDALSYARVTTRQFIP